MKTKTFFFLFLLFAASSANADLGTKIRTVGVWAIFRSEDPMTDKASCTAVFNEHQMVVGKLYIGVPHGPKTAVLRFDAEPALPLRLTSNTETKIDSIFIEGRDFAKVLTSQRLRFSSLNVFDQLIQGEIPLKDAPAIQTVLRSKACQ